MYKDKLKLDSFLLAEIYITNGMNVVSNTG